ncbi:MAG: hypothetical protein ACK40D_08720 [Cyanobacteriota bacterium]|jgi:hypothetical protein
MLTPSTRLRLQAILARIGADQPVTLQERIYLQKFADRDQGVAAWLLKARRQQLQQSPAEPTGRDGIDHLLDQMNLGPVDPDSTYRPGEDDIEGWFGGAPGWLRRS